jgi:ferric-dicitrate binding protein FerR (iron transport regulator)
VLNETDSSDQPADDASRGVARISFINGDVSVRRGDSGEIVAAAINAPLVLQDSLLTGSGATAEIQFDSANMIRLGQNSEVRLTELAYQRAQIQVATGTATFRVLRDSDARMEIDTPQVSVRPMRLGSYRITIREDGTSEIAVRSGEAEIFSPRGSEALHAGQMIVARGTQRIPNSK